MNPRDDGKRRGNKRAQKRAAPPHFLSRLLQDHVRALEGVLLQLGRRWPGTILTLVVLGVTLALPAGLQVARNNLARAGLRLSQHTFEATLFLKDSVSQQAGLALARQINKREDVRNARYISKSDALKEFENHGGTAAIALLAKNPLPASITVAPNPHQTERQIQTLIQRLSALPQVEKVQFDRRWIKRIFALAMLIERILLTAMVILAFSVIVVIANTIRLDIESHRDEIEILKLFGATDAYVRRPFLYSGACYGLAASVLAVILVDGAAAFLNRAAEPLARFYGNDLSIHGLQLTTALFMAIVGVTLGWAGAFWSVSRYLHHVEPQ